MQKGKQIGKKNIYMGCFDKKFFLLSMNEVNTYIFFIDFLDELRFFIGEIPIMSALISWLFT
jgi:hypothetical protein